MSGTDPDTPIPSGEATYLFTDVVGSSKAWQQNSDFMHEALRIHDEVIRSVFARHGGFVFSVAGDAFGAAFDKPGLALAAAVDIQLGLSQATSGSVSVAVRAGLHTGDSLERDGNYFGTNVNRAARIQSMGRGGQVLLSRQCADLVSMKGPDGYSVVSIGEKTLRSFDDREELFQLLGDGLSDDTSTESSAVADNLPNPVTRFVGRVDDVAGVSQELRPGKLVTLVGLGGLGKTRLSIEIARSVAPDFSDGLWWIDLAPLSDASAIAPAMTAMMGVGQQQPDVVEVVIDRLAGQRALLIFDNCEHIIDGVATLVSSIHRRCPEVAVLATSREPLGISGERVWPVRPLSASDEAVDLLIDRVAERDAKLDTSGWNRQDLGRLCERLDGMPLAIEMAAARLQTMSPREVLRRLEDRFRLLRSRQRDVSDRHQTLLAALDWSYDLLDQQEQALLDRLSVFGGTFDLEAAEQICADELVDSYDVIDLVASLVDKSLVTVLRSGDATRYRLLETVRQYSMTHLDQAGLDALRSRHLGYMTRLMVATNVRWNGRSQGDFDLAQSSYISEWDNVRDAVAWAVIKNDTDKCALLLESVWTYASESSHFEVGDWADEALAMHQPPAVAYAMVALKSRRRRGRALIAEAWDVIGPLSEPVGGASLIFQVDEGMKGAAGDRKGAAEAAELALFHAPALGPNDVAFQEAALADYLSVDDPDRAAECAASVHRYLSGSTNPMRSLSMGPLGIHEAASGRPAEGYELCAEGARLAGGAGLDWTESMATVARARVAMQYGVGDPAADVSAALRLHRQKRAWYALWFLFGEMLPWLRSSGRDALANTIEHQLAANDNRGGEAADGSSNMTREDLIDRVLRDLEKPPHQSRAMSERRGPSEAIDEIADQ